MNQELAQQILDCTDIILTEVVIPEWNNATLYVRPLTGEDRFQLTQVMAEVPKGKNSCAAEAWVCLGLVDSEGTHVFSLDQRHALARKNPAVIDRLYSLISKLSGVERTSEDDAEKK